MRAPARRTRTDRNFGHLACEVDAPALFADYGFGARQSLLSEVLRRLRLRLLQQRIGRQAHFTLRAELASLQPGRAHHAGDRRWRRQLVSSPMGLQRGWALELELPRRLRMTPMIIGTRDSRIIPTTSSDRFCLMNGTLPKK